ncbi:ATP-binding protein [Acidithiobacillus ferruginosus]|uniref:ATP-binding protein n=1 Tax=Acidithiobacillus ferruginosus TaxID=3063951 RepID=A0ACD5IGP9_9PROT|nr:ATP-binding protein [Acidithiobacillus ferruginosus]MBU2815215.1 ATP-binding protein [Acidithiobacillus ferruginosus]
MSLHDNHFDLTISNIGVISSANVRIENLTVIGGPNNSGKSTIGKLLMAMIKSDVISKYKNNKAKSSFEKKTRAKVFCDMEAMLFGKKLFRFGSDEGSAKLEREGNRVYEITVRDKKPYMLDAETNDDSEQYFRDAMIVSTPLIWDMIDLFRSVQALKEASSVLNLGQKIRYPYVQWDVFTKLELAKDEEADSDMDVGNEFAHKIMDIIAGDFQKNKSGSYNWKPRHGGNYDMVSTASGVKWFGLLLALARNGAFRKDRLVILDEPETHLHPEWQLKMAELLVFMSKKMHLIVTTHSPYLSEAIELYSEQTSDVSWHASIPESDGCIIKHLDCPQEIYEQLYSPIPKLELLRVNHD